MATFKKVPVEQNAPAESSHFKLPGVDHKTLDTIMQVVQLYWPLALGVFAVSVCLLKGYRWLAVVAAFAATVLEVIVAGVLW